MSVQIKKCMGRFGNQLCPLFFGKILSENLKFQLNGPTNSDPEFALTGIDLEYNKPGYASYDIPVQYINNHSKHDAFSNLDYNILDIINDKTPRKIILDGYFQKKYFFEPYKDNIKTWFNITPFNIKPDSAAIHIRIGDLLLGNNAEHLLPYDYYEYAATLINFNKLTICTDSPDAAIVRHLIDKYDATIFNDNEKNTISFLAQHNKLILSQGTFSFWAGFLSNGEQIINAIPKTGWNSINNGCGIDLLPQGDNYTYIRL